MDSKVECGVIVADYFALDYPRSRCYNVPTRPPLFADMKFATVEKFISGTRDRPIIYVIFAKPTFSSEIGFILYSKQHYPVRLRAAVGENTKGNKNHIKPTCRR